MARDQLYMQDLMYDRPEQWQDRANCRDKPLDLFEYTEKDSPLAVGMSFKQRLAFNQSNFERAEEICIECAVFFDCANAATLDENFWTVRGGKAPARFALDKDRYKNQGRPKKSTLSEGGRQCVRGHFVAGSGACKECKAENNLKWRQNASAGTAKSRSKPGEDRICDRGHKIPGGGYCKECKRIKDRERRRRNLGIAYE